MGKIAAVRCVEASAAWDPDNELANGVRTSDSGLRDLEELALDETGHQRGFAYRRLSQKDQLELVDLGVHVESS